MNNLINMKFSEDDMIIRFTINSDGEITNSNLIFMMETEEEEEQYSKEFRKTVKEAREQYMKDKIKAYKFIAKNIDKWWD